MTCPTCARHKRDLDHARAILVRIHRGEPIDDGRQAALVIGMMIGGFAMLAGMVAAHIWWTL